VQLLLSSVDGSDLSVAAELSRALITVAAVSVMPVVIGGASDPAVVAAVEEAVAAVEEEDKGKRPTTRS